MEIKNLTAELPWHATRRWSSRELSRVNKIVIHQELGEGTIEAVNNLSHSAQSHFSKRLPAFLLPLWYSKKW
jgi:hypothetical protein